MPTSVVFLFAGGVIGWLAILGWERLKRRRLPSSYAITGGTSSEPTTTIAISGYTYGMSRPEREARIREAARRGQMARDKKPEE